jgi:uncharacterized Zn finger protein (UPF0148 family)
MIGLHDYHCEDCDTVVEDHNSVDGHAVCPECEKEMEIVWHPVPFSMR